MSKVTTVFYELQSSRLSPLQTPPDMSIEILPLENIDRLLEVWPVNLEEMRQRMLRGDLCYVGSLNGESKIAHYSWVQRSGLHRVLDAGLTLPVSSEEFWIYHCRTAEWARGRNIYASVLAHIMREQFAEGRRIARIYTTAKNIASQRGIVKAGFLQTGSEKALRVGARYFRV